MEDTDYSKITYTNLQLANASKMIEKGQFEESYKLCLYLKDLLEEVSNSTEPNFCSTLYRLGMLFVDLGNMASNNKAAELDINIMESEVFASILTCDSYYYNLGNAKSNLIRSAFGDQLDTNVELIKQLVEVSSLFFKAVLSCRKQSIDPYLITLLI